MKWKLELYSGLWGLYELLCILGLPRDEGDLRTFIVNRIQLCNIVVFQFLFNFPDITLYNPFSIIP